MINYANVQSGMTGLNGVKDDRIVGGELNICFNHFSGVNVFHLLSENLLGG